MKLVSFVSLLLLARAVQLDPNTLTGIYGQAGQFLAAGVPLMAYLQFNTVLAIDPNQGGAYHGFGFAASQLGMKDRAIDALQRYLRFDQTSAYAQSARDEIARLSR